MLAQDLQGSCMPSKWLTCMLYNLKPRRSVPSGSLQASKDAALR